MIAECLSGRNPHFMRPLRASVSLWWLLSKARAAEFLTEVVAVDTHNAAHLVQARTHPFPNTVSETLFAGCAPRSCQCPGRLVLEIGGDDRRPVVVVAGIQDETYRVPNPLGRLDRAQFVQDQHLRLKHWPQNVKLGRLDGIVVGVLDLLQQLTVIVEEARDVLLEDEFLHDPHSQVGLADTNGANQEQPGIFKRIMLDKAMRLEQRLLLRGMRPLIVSVELGEL